MGKYRNCHGKGRGKDIDDELDEEGGEPVRKPKKVKPGSALVVVESPAKAKTIGKYLGAGYVVKASVGHVRDLRKKDGVDIENGFEPVYEVIEGKKKVVAEIRKAARENETVDLASDPDREGEAIAWHIAEEIKDVNKNYRRILINEITKKGVTEALKAPRNIDMNRTDAQQARRILDRLVGFQISPILWEKVQRGLSAGRVQSVAVRLVCERDEEIKAFKPEEYWSVDVSCRAKEPPPFEAPAWALAPLEKSLDRAYQEWTFHGPLFQRITDIAGIGVDSMLGTVYSPSATAALSGIGRPDWIIDPFVFRPKN